MDKAKFDALVELYSDWRTNPPLPDSFAEHLATLYRRSGSVEERQRLLAVLLTGSETIAFYWDSVNILAQQLLKDRVPLPGMLADWVADRLAGERPQPSKRGQNQLSNYGRDILIVNCVSFVRLRESITVTRDGDAKIRVELLPEEKRGRGCAEGGSACDVAAKAFCVGYRRVVQIWGDREKTFSVPIIPGFR